MISYQKWTSLVAFGLLAWQTSPVAAQTSPAHESPTLAQPRVADRRADFIIGSAPDVEADDTAGESESSDDAAAESPEDGSYIQRPSEDAGIDGSNDGDATETEVIKERFPDGSIKIEREVTQDAQSNYINHGLWKMWDQHGNPVAQGEYRYGNRTGTWIRWYRNPSEAELLKQPPYRQFTLPLISQATFEHGQLHGAWTIYDAKKQKISQWEFADGRRHGNSTWWYPSGKKMREIQYRDGQIDGHLMEFNAEGAVTQTHTYQEGRKLAQKTSTYPQGAKKSQGMYLFAKDVEQTPDDWWNCKLMTTVKTGKDEKHGAWTSWHSSGQPQLEGNYDHDLQIGTFSWWHANGQRALQGRFEAGKQDGPWTWWYSNGQKSIHGEYAHGNPTGRWTWWKEDGRVAQSADLSHSEGVVIETPPSVEPAPMPTVRKPMARKATVR